MKHPDKWRETVDPFSLPYRHFQLTEVLGYLPISCGRMAISPLRWILNWLAWATGTLTSHGPWRFVRVSAF